MAATAPQEAAWTAERDRYFIRNYTAHCAEGGLFDGGLHLIDVITVLPPLIAMLGGAGWLVGLMPVMVPIGFMVPGIFVAHLIERLPRFKMLNIITGTISRLFLLAVGLILLLCHQKHPTIALWTVALSPLLLGLPLGVSAPGWMTMVSRMIPIRRISSSWAIRLASGALLGLPAAYAVQRILAAYPGPTGYGILHLGAFGVLLLSFAAFVMLREVPGPPTVSPGGFIANLRLVPAMLKEDRNLRTFIYAILTGGGVFMLVPFLSLYACAVLKRDNSFIGILLMWKLGGALIGTMLGGLLGDLKGPRIVLIIGRLVEVALCLWLLFAGQAWEFYIIHLLIGVIEICIRVGNPTLTLEISTPAKRPTYTGLLSLISIFGMAGGGIAGGIIWGVSNGNLVLAAGPAAMLCLFSTIFLLRIREPRKAA